ncbi:MAG: carbohydrate ABC transporter permease [Firmicutes bacterium]|jgi:multiple sugar transport system permease protein|nr:carbohydrate ABC transporter permease [Bacillota bacterium]
MSARIKRTAIDWIVLVLTMVLALVFVFPFFWMFSTATKPTEEVFKRPPELLSSKLTFKAFSEVWQTRPMGTFFFNSAVVAFCVTVVAVSLAFLAAYGFSRWSFRGKKGFLGFIIATQMLPEVLLITPYFIVMARLGLVNTRFALMLAYSSFALPFCTWMLKGFIDSLPRELDEAALIDGCSRLQLLFRVIAPLALPGLGVTVLFSLLLSWNHYLFAMVLVTDEALYTFPVGLASFIGEYVTTWNQVMAGAIIATIPIILSAAFLERYLVTGLSAGAVKQ